MNEMSEQEYNQEDMKKMFFAGMDWEQKTNHPISNSQAFEFAIRKIKPRFVRVPATCENCNSQDECMFSDGKNDYCEHWSIVQ